jgi:DNA-binding transcriptional MerR regulator/methylmalonyl-CoA mutase cobalamin-binding subunit
LTSGGLEKTLNHVYRIRAVARMTGLAPGLIRAWERRYGLIQPERSTGKYRLYSDRQVAVLRGAKALVDQGLAIGEVAHLDPERLLAAVPATPPPPPVDSGRLEAALAGAIAAIRRFDRDALEAMLGRFAGTLAPVELCRQVLLPLLREVGQAWYRQELTVAMEHFGSALVRARILRTLERLLRQPGGPRVVCACPEGELHEGALLTFAVHAAAQGWEVIYLGASVPDDDLLDTVQRVQAQLLALSVTMDGKRERVRRLVKAIRGHASELPRVIVGGAGAIPHRALFEAAGMEVAGDINVPLAFARARR